MASWMRLPFRNPSCSVEILLDRIGINQFAMGLDIILYHKLQSEIGW
jgi:hypothetical protein